MVKAIGYSRVSSEEQVREGVSLAAQRAAIESYCRMRGVDLVEVIEDAGVSGGKSLASRVGGGRLIEIARKRGIDAVVAVRLDRLFRDAADCLRQTREWDKASTALHLLDLGGSSIDTTTPIGRFFLTTMSAIGELERGLVRERTVAALAHKRKIGEKTGGDPPYGYATGDDGKTLVPVEAEQAVISRIQSMHAGGLSIRCIVARLNDEHVAARGSRWHRTTVHRLLRRGRT